MQGVLTLLTGIVFLVPFLGLLGFVIFMKSVWFWTITKTMISGQVAVATDDDRVTVRLNSHDYDEDY